MPVGDSNQTNEPVTMAILSNVINNLMKKDTISKPPPFSIDLNSFQSHLSKVENYCKYINAKADLDKVLILWETLSDEIKNEVIFDAYYEKHCEEY